MIIYLLALVVVVKAFDIRDKYCGKKDCFELLGLKSNATPEEIRKGFREQSKIYHPDKSQSRGEDTTEIYKQIIQAYEVLGNEELRTAYLDFLKNPNANQMYHHYKYYQQRIYQQQSNPYVVVSVIVIALSTIQYVARDQMHKSAVRYAKQTTHFKSLLNQRYKEALASDPKITKDEVERELESTININGAYSKPKFRDIVFVSLTLYFWGLIYDIYFSYKWKRNYANKEDVPEYYAAIKTSKVLKIGWNKWMSMPTEERESFVDRKLWIPQNMRILEQEQKEQLQEHMKKHPTRYKQMQRWARKNQ